jgi:predicted AAA+ superfamily ATPase
MYENFVAQELFAKDNRLYYFNNHNVGEVDFVIEKDNGICLIEVKSGKDYYVHQALNNLSAILEYNIKSKYVLSFNNIEEKDGIIYLPIYLTMFL